jgi:hypothetical protein
LSSSWRRSGLKQTSGPRRVLVVASPEAAVCLVGQIEHSMFNLTASRRGILIPEFITVARVVRPVFACSQARPASGAETPCYTFFWSATPSLTCRSGETGRRAGLKTQWSS